MLLGCLEDFTHDRDDVVDGGGGQMVLLFEKKPELVGGYVDELVACLEEVFELLEVIELVGNGALGSGECFDPVVDRFAHRHFAGIDVRLLQFLLFHPQQSFGLRQAAAGRLARP